MHFSKKKRTRTVTKKETDEFLESGWGETKKIKDITPAYLCLY